MASAASDFQSNSSNSLGGSKNFTRTPTSWDAQDDLLLMHLKDQQKLGWKEIAGHFNNRTPNACQFRWRRLKSGNLRNVAKTESATSTPNNESGTEEAQNEGNHKNAKLGKGDNESFDANKETTFYSPVSSATFTGYDTSVNNALAGLNALSNTSSNLSTPGPHGSSAHPPQPITVNNHRPSFSGTNFDKSPKSEVGIDPQHNPTHSGTGGYYAEISVDPTMNLPQNQSQGGVNLHITPRNSSSHGSQANIHNGTNQQMSNIHNNSIIQIVRDDRNSISSLGRASVSSLPSKSMNIPHHQLTNNLAHLPVLFGGNSVSGPSRPSSFSGPGMYSGSLNVNNTSGARSDSVSGNLTYYSRSGSVVIPHTGERKEDEPNKDGEKGNNTKESKKQEEKGLGSQNNSKSNSTLRLPWSMDEDELLINRRNRELSFAELSILLPQRTEGEIWSRIDYLERILNGQRTSRDSRRHRHDSIGLDDVDLYEDEDEDDVISGLHMVEDDEDAVEDDDFSNMDDSLFKNKRRKKRSSSQSSLKKIKY